ncbi:MAG TPA: hypothetical protein VGB78_07100 [Thermoplasmata archaeon]
MTTVHEARTRKLLELTRAEKEFEIKADADAVIAFLTVPEFVAKLLPFVEAIDERGHWIMIDHHAKVTHTKTLAPTLTVESGGVVEWVGKGEGLTSTMRFDVSPVDKTSRVKAALRMEVVETPGSVLSPILSLNIRDQLDAVARSLAEEFKDSGCYANECSRCPMCGM